MYPSLGIYLLTLTAAAGSVQSSNCHQIILWSISTVFNWIRAAGKCIEGLMCAKADVSRSLFASACRWVKLETWDIPAI